MLVGGFRIDLLNPTLRRGGTVTERPSCATAKSGGKLHLIVGRVDLLAVIGRDQVPLHLHGLRRPAGAPRAGRWSTAARALFPTLAFWTAATGDIEALGFLAEFRERSFSHSTLQLWLPDEDPEAHLYLNNDTHGAAYTDIPIATEPKLMAVS